MAIIQVEDHFIGDGQSCFIIAEIGINHNGNIDTAKQMIDAAKQCGVDAVKFQTFKPEEFVSDPKETYTYHSQGKKVTESMLEMFKRYEFTENEWKDIFHYCKQKKLLFFSTPQNRSDLDLLLSIVDLPLIKVGSDDLTNLPLLKYYASKKIPIIISTGMANLCEIEDATEAVRHTGNDKLIVLHCVSSYPTDPKDVNLRKMATIKQAFQVIVGFSDHTVGVAAATAAVSLGAKVVEKHFTMDKNMPGPDHWFSSDASELRILVDSIRFVEKALGSPVVTPTEKEKKMKKIARRSIVAKKEIPKGSIVTEDMIAVKRPGIGLPPKFIEYIIGKRSINDIGENELITFDKIIT